jgi:hypothetical protein
MRVRRGEKRNPSSYTRCWAREGERGRRRKNKKNKKIYNNKNERKRERKETLT